METIYRKVSAKERLPIQTGRYYTDRGLTNYFHEALKYPPKGFEGNVDYWLEEIELPTDEKIKTMTMEYDFSNELIFTAFYRGAQRMRDFVLAALPK